MFGISGQHFVQAQPPHCVFQPDRQSWGLPSKDNRALTAEEPDVSLRKTSETKQEERSTRVPEYPPVGQKH